MKYNLECADKSVWDNVNNFVKKPIREYVSGFVKQSVYNSVWNPVRHSVQESGQRAIWSYLDEM